MELYWTCNLLTHATEMQYTARMNGWTEFVTMQSLHNAVYREEEKEMYPACAKFGMGLIPWSPGECLSHPKFPHSLSLQ